MTLVRNITPGARGAWLDGKEVWAEPGEAIEADDFVEEWFAPVPEHEAETDVLDHDGNGEPGGSKPADPPALSGKTKAELLAIAEAEGVLVEDDATVAEIKTAIEAGRA
jgi:hypothetical protein